MPQTPPPLPPTLLAAMEDAFARCLASGEPLRPISIVEVAMGGAEPTSGPRGRSAPQPPQGDGSEGSRP